MNTMSTTNPILRTLALAGASVVLAGGLAACHDERSDAPPRQFLPDMDDSPKFKPQTQTEFFAEGRVMRPDVKGAVAFGDRLGQSERERATFLKESPEAYRGVDPSLPALADGTPQYVKFVPASVIADYIEANPGKDGSALSIDAAIADKIKRGMERFNIYCAVCHGFHGEGGDPANFEGGVVGRRWSYPVPSFHDPKYSNRAEKTGQDGYIFHTILHGVPEIDPTKPPKMPAYADKVSEADAWAIVLYMRTLQAGWKDPNPPAAPAAPAPSAAANPGATPVAAATSTTQMNDGEVKP